MTGRVALVTGGSRGIGRAIAEHLGGTGYRVVVNYASRADAAAETVAAIEASGGMAMAAGADVGNAAEVERMLAEVEDGFGPVEVLVNNAGVTRDSLLVRLKPEDWDEVIRVNLRSVYVCTRAVLRPMLKSRWGRIVSISSVAGVGGNPGQANYAAAKAGIIGFSRSVAKEVGTRGITANVVAPGFIETDMTAVLGEKVREAALPLISLGRFGAATEVASAVGYLCSDAAGYITGHVLRVDGGLSV